MGMFSWFYRLCYNIVSTIARISGVAYLLSQFAKWTDFYLATIQSVNPNGALRPEPLVATKFNHLRNLFKSLTSLNDNALFDALKNTNGVGIDDRNLLLEDLVEFMATLKDDTLSQTAQKLLLNMLYHDLPHPPSNYLAPYPLTVKPESVPQDYVKYAYRSADGSFNNPLVPTLGQAGAPYARSVPPVNFSPKQALPDPGLVFDALLKRDKFEEHPGGMSSLFFAFADLVIHSIFYTDHRDWTKNNTSSYLDLSILYGNNQAQQDSVRRKDGSGKLHDDAFADARLLMMPPATCALLVLLNRNHNFIAQRLLEINENGNLKSNPDPEDKQAQDDEIFHRSRLVNCGYFMKIILGDYVGAILGLVKFQSSWRLDPLMIFRGSDHELCPTGQGNSVSLEFNLLYRWHSALSQPDVQWTEKAFSRIFPGKDTSKVTVKEFKQAIATQRPQSSLPQQWVFGGLKRDKNNRFNDEDLASIIQNATETPAAAFKARGIPQCLRVVEILGIEQSRAWSACSLNEFRKFLGLKPYKTFKEWNPNEEIHTAAAALYRNIDNLELYVGLQAEEAKPARPGSGLCPGYTVTRAILADAVALTRGDRYMTTELNPYNLTAWGYQDLQFDENDGSYGGVLTKLLFRTLSQYYPRRSAYAHFPFLTPKSMKPHMTKVNPELATEYIWTRPVLPPRKTHSIADFSSVNRILSQPSVYMSLYESQTFTVVQPVLEKKSKTLRNGNVMDLITEEEIYSNTVSASEKKLTTDSISLQRAIFSLTPETANSFADIISVLVKAKSFGLTGSANRNVDIVKDVINLLPVIWISRLLALPVKSAMNPNGAWDEATTCSEFADVGRYIYLNVDVVDDWKLRESAQATALNTIELIEAHINPNVMLDILNHAGLSDSNGHEFLHNLWHKFGKNQKDSSHRDFAARVFAAVVPSAALYSHYLALVVDFYLDNIPVRQEIVKLADSKNFAGIMAYVNEALRHRRPVPGVYRAVARDDVLDTVEVKTGAYVFASFVDDANSNPSASKQATKPGFIDFGAKGFLDSEFFKFTLPAVLGTIFKLEGLERGPDNSGKLICFEEELHGTKVVKYINLQGYISPWADSIIVQHTM